MSGPRRPVSLSRRLSERSREPAATMPPTGSVGGLLGGLGQMLQGLQQALEQAANSPDGDRRVVVGYSLKVGPLGAEAQPFGDVAPTPAADPVARQPIVDVFEEPDAILVVAEVPGAAEGAVSARVEDDTLLIEVPPPRAYRKRIALPGPVDAAGLILTCRNGILEVRLPRRSGDA